MSDATRRGSFSDLSCVFSDNAATPNTATVAGYQGDYKLGNVMAAGRAPIVNQAQGAITSIVKGAREIPTLAMSFETRAPLATVQALLLGETSGYVNPYADTGAPVTVNGTMTLTVGTSTRTIAFTKAHAVIEYADGDGATTSLAMQIFGSLTIDSTEVVPDDLA